MVYKQVELWTMDEHRIGLQPILRKIWAPKGRRPIIAVKAAYEWLYLYAFVQPQTGQSLWYILPSVNIQAMQLVLDNFARDRQLSEHKHLLLMMDQAPWHTSDKLATPKGMELLFQPAYSPELQPAEHLWQLTDEALYNQTFKNLDALELALSEQCVKLMADPERVKAHTLFH